MNQWRGGALFCEGGGSWSYHILRTFTVGSFPRINQFAIHAGKGAGSWGTGRVRFWFGQLAPKMHPTGREAHPVIDMAAEASWLYGIGCNEFPPPKPVQMSPAESNLIKPSKKLGSAPACPPSRPPWL